jgi:hypothetical protein
LPVAYSRVVGYESAAVVGFVASEEDLGLVSSSVSQLDLNPIGEVASALIVVRALTRASSLRYSHTPHCSCGVFEISDVEQESWVTMNLDRPDHLLNETREDGKISCTAAFISTR